MTYWQSSLSFVFNTWYDLWWCHKPGTTCTAPWNQHYYKCKTYIILTPGFSVNTPSIYRRMNVVFPTEASPTMTIFTSLVWYKRRHKEEMINFIIVLNRAQEFLTCTVCLLHCVVWQIWKLHKSMSLLMSRVSSGSTIAVEIYGTNFKASTVKYHVFIEMSFQSRLWNIQLAFRYSYCIW